MTTQRGRRAPFPGSHRSGCRVPRAPAVLVLVLCLAAGCRQDYQLDLPPPLGHEVLAQVLPVAIAGAERRLLPLEDDEGRPVGVRAGYGPGARIEVVRPGSAAALDRWVERRIVPRLAGYPRHRQDRGREGWRLEGRGGHARLLAWQRQDWLFLIEADDAARFDALVAGFPYIRRR